MKTHIIFITNVKGTSKEPASDEASRMKRTNPKPNRPEGIIVLQNGEEVKL